MGAATTLSVDVPLVETDRLILRAPRLEDLEPMVAFYATERSRWVGGPCNRYESWLRLSSAVGHWLLRGHGMWTIEEKATGAVAGRAGVIHHADWPEPELGWHLYEGFEGRGIGHEAALAARNAARDIFGLGPLVSLIVPENRRSRALAERLGATVEREGAVLGHPCLVYRHPRSA
ncbi:GNAT family N-acetyltransferase [Paracoccus sp. (in: a-proteobacteria)]|uniref:GNAT family N-acetyltransferase n=1 Tax=Paracoccus sp. TaxID=267 RepID=UPI00321FE5EB